jgi:hypothetical protein
MRGILSPKNKYERNERAKYDKAQMCFQGETVIANPRTYANIELEFKPNKILVCPFCLTQHELRLFLIPSKSKSKTQKANHYLGLCPECKNQVTYKILFACGKWNGSEFADFVFPYAKMGFFKKIYPDFKTWNERLRDTGESFEFWLRYHLLKGENPNPNYEQEQKEQD